jgi:parallel beta-helix repeat protein
MEIMKIARTILTVSMLVISIFVGLIGLDSIQNVEAPYIPHLPFRINNNSEFASMAGSEGWTGDGSPANPYMIGGYDINGSGYGYCIYIGNTTVHFEVKDSYLHEASGIMSSPYFYDSGTILYNVKNGTMVNNTVSLNIEYGIYLDHSNNNTISNNNVSDNGRGINLNYSIRNSITNNTAMNNIYGIYITSSHYNTIDNNTTTKDYFGIRVSNSNSNIFSNNNISSNIWDGLYLTDSNLNSITKNNVSSNDYGIYLFYSDNNSITSNNASLNNDYGIYLRESPDNIVYHNTFINNTFQAYDDSFGNLWDDGYPMGGNYWGNYDGNDSYKGPFQNILGSDGIGDTPYFINLDSQDNYPLMAPFSNRTYENFSVLKQGWNLISVPLIQGDRNLEKVLEMIEGYYDAVQWYDGLDPINPWKHHKVGKLFGNELFELNETQGFWIHISREGNTIFLHNGTQPLTNQTISLHPGWNMVGYPSLTNRNRTSGLNNLTYGVEVDAIWSFNAAKKKWMELNEVDHFKMGKGYWIHTITECEWEVPI